MASFKDLVPTKVSMPISKDTKTEMAKAQLLKEDVSDDRIYQEFLARASLDCNKRCLVPSKEQGNTRLSDRESICFNRCLNKYHNVREVFFEKYAPFVDRPVGMYGGNLI
jgi:hypothetical protein